MTNEIKTIVAATVAALQRGEVILYPTDTIWGLGCDATNVAAVERLYNIKGRDHSKSMLVLVEGEYDATERPVTRILPRELWQGLIQVPIAPNLIAADGTLGVRVPHHDFCQALINQLGKPLVSTSANFSGMPSPMAFCDIDGRLRAMVGFSVPPLEELHSGEKRPSRIVKLSPDGSEIVIRD